MAFCDPIPDISFGYTVQRMPVPGGMDQRSLELARLVRRAVRAAYGTPGSAVVGRTEG